MRGSKTFRRLPDAPIFVGVTGHSWAGKSSVAEYLVHRYEFESVRYSRVLQDWLLESGRAKARMQEVGWAVMSSGRQAELNAQLVLRVNRMRNTVIDGLRHPVDFDYLSQFFGRAFRLIFVRADRSVRLQRSLSGLGSVAAFEKSEQQPVESFIDELLPFSFAAVSNNGPLEHLHSELRDVLERLFAEALT